ncbi:hypothetical protein [Alloactinosynnema sp. L-07]|nr:hypothetical protein [Alloactinosynnema sp. L-07]
MIDLGHREASCADGDKPEALGPFATPRTVSFPDSWVTSVGLLGRVRTIG